jgi:hypothetical protein
MLSKAIFSVLYIAVNLSAIAMNSERYLKLIRDNDISELSEDFNNSLQITTPGKGGVYSKSQAEIILTDFFSYHQPKSVSLSSRGQSSNGAQFVVLNVNSNRGNVKMSIFYRVNGSISRIHEIKIQK